MIKTNDIVDKKVTLIQIKSGNKMNQKQKGSLIGLGLRGIGSSSNLVFSNSIIGMYKKVQHVVKISLNQAVISK